MHHAVMSLVVPLAPPHFLTLSHKRRDLGGGGGELLNIKCVFDFLYKFCLQHFSF
jgi:hypothetical protein